MRRPVAPRRLLDCRHRPTSMFIEQVPPGAFGRVVEGYATPEVAREIARAIVKALKEQPRPDEWSL